MRGLIVATALALSVVATPCLAQEKWLSGDQIRAALSDKTLLGANGMKNIKVKIYSGAAGEWVSLNERGKLTKFEWSVRGNEHCKEDDGQMGCGPIVAGDAPGVYHKYLKGKRRFTYTVIADGNQLEKQAD